MEVIEILSSSDDEEEATIESVAKIIEAKMQTQNDMLDRNQNFDATRVTLISVQTRPCLDDSVNYEIIDLS